MYPSDAPFATTYEGTAQAGHDLETKKFSFSVKPVPAEENGAGGSILLSLCAKNLIIDGMDDGFIVKIRPEHRRRTGGTASGRPARVPVRAWRAGCPPVESDDSCPVVLT